MNLLRWLFGDTEEAATHGVPLYYEPFRVPLSLHRAAVGVRTPVDGDGSRAVTALGLAPGETALFIAGGAGKMEPHEMQRTRPLLLEGLLRFAEDHHIAVVDGGTDAGVMKLIGDAHAERGYPFPLVGVAPVGAVRFPGYDNPDGVPLNGGHTHLVLTDGDRFGAESDMIVRVAAGLARGGRDRIFGVVINGGEVTRQETYARAITPNRSIPMLVLEGSGRFGDELASALRGIAPDDPRTAAIVATGDLRLASADDGPERLYTVLRQFLP